MPSDQVCATVCSKYCTAAAAMWGRCRRVGPLPPCGAAAGVCRAAAGMWGRCRHVGPLPACGAAAGVWGRCRRVRPAA